MVVQDDRDNVRMQDTIIGRVIALRFSNGRSDPVLSVKFDPDVEFV